jgi:thiamine kinase-like enzyme
MEVGFVRKVAAIPDGELVEMEVLDSTDWDSCVLPAVAVEEIDGGQWTEPLVAWASDELGSARPRLPWELPGWRDEARRWLDQVIASRGWATTGNGTHLSHSRNAVVLFPTTGGDVVVKATPTAFGAEGRVTAFVSRHVDGVVPDVLGFDSSRSLWASFAFAGAEVPPISDEKYMEALQLLVQIQRGMIGRVQELLSSGCRDRRGEALAHQVQRLLDSQVVEGLSIADQRRVGRAAARLIEGCRSLSQSPLPATIVHGDFGTNNAVLMNEDRWMLIDWEWASIGDPFLDFAAWSNCMHDDAARVSALSLMTREWSIGVSHSAVQAHARASAAPACLARACDNAMTGDCLTGSEAAQWHGYARWWLLRSLEVQQPGWLVR